MIVSLDKKTFKPTKKEKSGIKNENLILNELAKILAKEFVREVLNNDQT